MSNRMIERMQARIAAAQEDIAKHEAELFTLAKKVAEGHSGSEARYEALQEKISKARDKIAMYEDGIAAEEKHLAELEQIRQQKELAKQYIELERQQRQSVSAAKRVLDSMRLLDASIEELENSLSEERERIPFPQAKPLPRGLDLEAWRKWLTHEAKHFDSVSKLVHGDTYQPGIVTDYERRFGGGLLKHLQWRHEMQCHKKITKKDLL